MSEGKDYSSIWRRVGAAAIGGVSAAFAGPVIAAYGGMCIGTIGASVFSIHNHDFEPQRHAAQSGGGPVPSGGGTAHVSGPRITTFGTPF